MRCLQSHKSHLIVTLITGILARFRRHLFSMALGTTGLFAGQMVRQARRMIENYPMLSEATTDPNKGQVP